MKRAIKRDGASLILMLLLALLVGPALAQNKNSRPTSTASLLQDDAKKSSHAPANTNSKPGGKKSSTAERTPVDANTDNDAGNSNRPRDTLNGNDNAQAGTSDGSKSSDAAGASLISAGNILMAVSVVLVLLMVGLHIVHLISAAHLKQDLAGVRNSLMQLRQQVQQMNGGLQNLAARPASPAPALAPAFDNVAARVDQQQRAVEQLAERLEEMRCQMLDKIQLTAQAVALHEQLSGAARLRREQQVAASAALESGHAQAVTITEKYRDLLGANANAVKPLVEAVAALNYHIQHRPRLPAELANLLQSLDEEIRQFDRWHAEAEARLASLRRGSISERLRKFQSREQKLGEAFTLNEISVFDYIKQHDVLMQECFADDGSAASMPLSVAEQESQFKKFSASAPDHLMNWFDKLFQMQIQLNATAGVDAQTSEELAFVQQLAKDALGRFDIQPEEIQPGRTSFDNRLYDAALVTQSSHYPANTVIGVQQCGFRRRSNGEVLRRPKVIVAGLGAAL